MKRKYIMVALLFLASACLTLACYIWVKKSDTPKEKLAVGIKQQEITFQKYFQADYDSAKEAMLNCITLLDKLSSESKNPGRNPSASDAVFWYVRLAKLEEKNNHPEEKNKYMQEALSRCQSVGSMNCSWENLQQNVERMDVIALNNQ
jgi:hypothetical protein